MTQTENVYSLKLRTSWFGRRRVRLNDHYQVVRIQDAKLTATDDRDWALDLVEMAYGLKLFSQEDARLLVGIVERRVKVLPLTLKGTPLEAPYNWLLKQVTATPINFKIEDGQIVTEGRPLLDVSLSLENGEQRSLYFAPVTFYYKVPQL
ncbi:MAG: hypothetical protein V4611_04770 [Patescibacteria group bacterium]